MKPTLTALCLLSAVSVATSPADVYACDIFTPPTLASLPRPDAVVGPRPILSGVAFDGNFSLRNSDGVAFELQEAAGFPSMSYPSDADTRFIVLTPRAALPAGKYLWRASGLDPGTRFVVSEDAAQDIPAEIARADLLLDIRDRNESGCCGDHDPTRLVLVLEGENDRVAEHFVLTVSTDDVSRTWFVAADPRRDADAVTISIGNDNDLNSFRNARTCVTVAPVSASGDVGQTLDAGCITNDGQDPRVSEVHDGCALGSGGSNMNMWLVCLLLGSFIARPRARRSRVPANIS